MVDVNKPVTNPELVEAIAALRQQDGTEAQNRMIDAMMRAHFLIPVELQPPPALPDEKGEIVLKENLSIRFSILEDAQGRRFFPAFTDWEELRTWKAQENQQTVILTFDDYAHMLAQGRSAGFVINPFGQNVTMTREMTAALKREKDRRAGGVVDQTAPKDTKVLLGEPGEEPTALLKAVRGCLKERKAVKAAWLRLMVRGEERSWLLVLEFSGESRPLFEAVAQAARPHLGGLYLDMIPLDSQLGSSAVREAAPFYRRRRFGLFG